MGMVPMGLQQRPPQAPAQQPPDQPGDDASGGGAGVQQIVERIHTDLLKLQEIFGQSKIVPPPVNQKLGGIVDAFAQVVSELTGGQGGGEGQPQPGGPPAPQPGTGPAPMRG